MKEKLMNGLMGFAMFLQNQKHFRAIKNAFSSLLPIIIVGSFCTLFSNVVCNTTPGYFSLANVPGMSWLGNLAPMFTAANYGTMNFIAVGLVVLLSMELGESCGVHDRVLPIVAVGSYISLCSTTMIVDGGDGAVYEIANALTNQFTSAQGLFVGLFASIGSTELYCRLVNSGKMEIKMPKKVPADVSRSFAVLFPCVITIFAVSAIGTAFEMITGMTIFSAITTFIQRPLANVLTGLPGYLLLVFMTTLLWCFGIHGTQTLKAIYEPILLAAFAENEAAYAAGAAIPNVISTPFMSCFSTITGAGITGGLVIAIMIFSRREDYRAIAKLAIPCAVFNINEPLIFGLPIVMNPVLAIPFMIAPAVSAAFAYLMTVLGFCGRMVVNAPWTTPPVLMAFLSSGGSGGAAVTQLICIGIAVLIYIPFVMISNRQQEAEQ
ncbi:MAG TPA: PTS transporter subunit EIIC [Candidatus Lachnoclostridium stercorigallinarum]|uniref:Permease IIC component n=1 Tax=Candidatus Lachnoclostridium stercorigallinarum TaxID=2838634 RepID=A0A9D2GIF9_9FIRM|nr:PTS transporter subunit EIIC [Candidatus Lachnoclostridium stercorigallinarum]